MMVSTKGRYALRVMIDLAQHEQEGYIPLKDVSRRQEVSAKYLEAIAALLARGGVIQSQRGKEGGYRLSRPPEAITAGEVVRLTEGRLAPVSCLECGENTCARADVCLTLPMWERLDSLIETYLNSVTIRDIIDGKLKKAGDDNG
jgi:Rrf2 family iron-sulfur cluster assembly transcriptional regulator